MANFRVAYAPHLGAGWASAFRDGNVIDTDFRTIGGAPGLVFPFEGNLYQVVRNRTGGALAEGDLVKLFFNDATRVGTASAGAADTLTTTQTYTAGLLVDKSTPSYIFLRAGTGVNQRRRILSHTSGANSVITTSIFDRSLGLTNGASTTGPDKWGTTPDNTSQYSIVLPWEMAKSSGVGDYITGVALAAVTDAYWTIIQIAGFGLCKAVGSTDALTAGGPIVPSATAGVGKGFTTAGETAAEARLAFGMAIDAYTGASALRHILMLPRLLTVHHRSL